MLANPRNQFIQLITYFLKFFQDRDLLKPSSSLHSSENVSLITNQLSKNLNIENSVIMGYEQVLSFVNKQ